MLIRSINSRIAPVLGGLALAACVPTLPGKTQEIPVSYELPPSQAPTYVDLVELALEADLVAEVMVEEQIVVPPERAPGVAPGQVRLYLEALTQKLLVADTVIGESLVFLVDRDLDLEGDPPELEERSFLIFGHRVPGQANMLQLSSSQTMFPAGPVLEGRVRRVLTQLAAADTPSPITGLRDVISVPGNLAGESETQMFVETEAGAPISLTVIRRPGMEPSWGVSLGEIVDQSARPPEPETLAWYRFACELPPSLPDDAFLQSDRPSRERAREDYAYILRQLGPCERRLG